MPTFAMLRPASKLAILSLILLCGGCLGPVDGLYPPAPSEKLHDIYIYSNGWHTGLVLKAGELSPRAQTYLNHFEDYPWVEIGWGENAFYRASAATPGLALQAMFLSTGSVLHVVGVWPDPKTFYQQYTVTLMRITVGEAGFRQMENRILEAFKLDSAGQSMELEEGLYGFSRFYAGTGNYWIGHTCNNWTAEALRLTGYPITPCYAGTAGNLEYQMTHGKYRAAKVIFGISE